ncbi:DNA recombinase [Mycobacteroides abscessus subsp. abscessus]|uniref:Resolvase n=1 Tax=Mycobacteroides immunogenum TaxID=83262 RepID=A0A7V8RUN0_9MYCO|nr:MULTISPECIES: recombinase family protein [Mycobacteroides]AMT70549.1 resolvase [Mycobacteroides immunogenum]ANO03629.1 resolvase [Mycobacteroides immunogenum]KIU38496.1 resolvase [Mycobacteroides immunogenum]KPG04294.1 resolvase [Mycobacteroides immunogenum]KPG04789.1 resolvase [Mycobacteroides immunogenum]
MSTAVYLRVSTGHQSVEQQRDLLDSAGVRADREFCDVASGRAGSERTGWTECLGWLREGDTLVVAAVDRIGRSVREVASALADLTERGIALRSLREGVDTSTPTGRAVVQIMSSIAELELELGKERRQSSREARTARGLPATRPPKLDVAQQERLIRLYRSGEPVAELMSLFSVSRATVFRYVRQAS